MCKVGSVGPQQVRIPDGGTRASPGMGSKVGQFLPSRKARGMCKVAQTPGAVLGGGCGCRVDSNGLSTEVEKYQDACGEPTVYPRPSQPPGNQANSPEAGSGIPSKQQLTPALQRPCI